MRERLATRWEKVGMGGIALPGSLFPEHHSTVIKPPAAGGRAETKSLQDLV